MKKSVLQDWVVELPFMQQSVLLAAIRGPDGIKKDHPVKVLCRWFRRSILISAFDQGVIRNPVYEGGGSFTGPSVKNEELRRSCDGHEEYQCDEDICPPLWVAPMRDKGEEYLRHVDELPHHFQLHLMHAAEIIGYRHPDRWTQQWWNWFYLAVVNDAHLQPEPKEKMDLRLSDSEKLWREAEVVTAK